MNSAANYTVDRRTTPNTASQLTFLDLLLRWSEHIKREGQKTRKLCEMSITMHRRDRGLTLSDMCGRFGIRRDTEGLLVAALQAQHGDFLLDRFAPIVANRNGTIWIMLCSPKWEGMLLRALRTRWSL